MSPWEPAGGILPSSGRVKEAFFTGVECLSFHFTLSLPPPSLSLPPSMHICSLHLTYSQYSHPLGPPVVILLHLFSLPPSPVLLCSIALPITSSFPHLFPSRLTLINSQDPPPPPNKQGTLYTNAACVGNKTFKKISTETVGVKQEAKWGPNSKTRNTQQYQS